MPSPLRVTVVDVEDVELEDLARHVESFREGRPGAAMVPMDPFLHVGPGLGGHSELRTVSVDPDDFRRQEPSMPYGIRTPVNDPFGGALSDRLGHQNRERLLKLCLLHGRRHPKEDTVGLRDRKSTRLNSSHSQISYAAFCLKKKK